MANASCHPPCYIITAQYPRSRFPVIKILILESSSANQFLMRKGTSRPTCLWILEANYRDYTVRSMYLNSDLELL